MSARRPFAENVQEVVTRVNQDVFVDFSQNRSPPGIEFVCAVDAKFELIGQLSQK